MTAPSPAKHVLTLDRLLDAPVENVWRCWSEPKLLEEWFCPKPWRATEVVMDLRPGGEMTSVFRGSDGESFPNAGVFLITPICPHSLSQRALVLSDSCAVELSSEDPDGGPMLFTVDGRDTVRVEQGDRIEVAKSDRSFHLLRLEDGSFYEALRKKLGWQGV